MDVIASESKLEVMSMATAIGLAFGGNEALQKFLKE
jgi:hypothetical protein